MRTRASQRWIDEWDKRHHGGTRLLSTRKHKRIYGVKGNIPVLIRAIQKWSFRASLLPSGQDPIKAP